MTLASGTAHHLPGDELPVPVGADNLRQMHTSRLASLRRRGVKQVFVLACGRPEDGCRAVACQVWPIDQAPLLPQGECPWSPADPAGVWDGCEYAPFWGGLVSGAE